MDETRTKLAFVWVRVDVATATRACGTRDAT